MKATERREQLLARVADVLRRSGVEDAGRLIDALTRELLGPPVFSADHDTVFVFEATVPAGAFESVEMFRARNSSMMTTDGMFPFPFLATEAFVSMSDDLGPAFVAEASLGIEEARHPVERFQGPLAARFERTYSPDRFYGFRLSTMASAPPVFETPRTVRLAIAGWRR